MPRRGVIYTVAPSYKDINTIWCGTDDGLIHVTKDGGKTWSNVTPPEITSWSKISLMDASHFDSNTVYAAVNRIRCDDMRPHIYKTNDGGKTWKAIVNGLPNDPINVVREDPIRKGLLFAGSEKAVYVSFDDGEHWQTLRLNMPATSIRDLVIKDNDLVIGTHGRSFWILDDITPLRQINYQTITHTHLYKPAIAYRVRWNTWTDTPLPQEEPAGENPPDGAIINYYLKDNASEVILEIFDANNKLVRTFTNTDILYKIPAVNIPHYWIRPQQILPATKGAHRFVWDMHYTPLNISPSYPISAIYKNTAPDDTSPWVMPGTYKIKFSVNHLVLEKFITIKMDPRVKTSKAEMQRQHDLSLEAYNNRLKLKIMLDDLNSAPQNNTTALKSDLAKLDNTYASLLNILQQSDTAPTLQMINGVKEAGETFIKIVSAFNTFKSKS